MVIRTVFGFIAAACFSTARFAALRGQRVAAMHLGCIHRMTRTLLWLGTGDMDLVSTALLAKFATRLGDGGS
jgi:hypothetical protein